LSVSILIGDVRDRLRELPDNSVHCVVTSPPYFGLRDYGMPGQIGLEDTPQAFVATMVEVFREVRRALRDDGTLWLNLGDSYSGSGKGVWDAPEERKANVKEVYRPSVNPVKTITGLKPKDLIGIPWRVAFALQADGWYLRQDIIWSKPNPMPESVTDRCTKAHEYMFLLSKSARYYYDADAIRQPHERLWASSNGGNLSPDGDHKANGKVRERGGEYPEPNPLGANRRSVWTFATQPFSEAHFATFPPSLIEPCIKAGCPKGGTVLDPFGGAGTTGLVADRLGRDAILIELNPEYAAIAERRIKGDAPMFASVISSAQGRAA